MSEKDAAYRGGAEAMSAAPSPSGWIPRLHGALIAAALLAGGAAFAQPAAAQKVPPQRIVSLNVCTDQLLILLAPREHIAAVSYLARDPEVSMLSEEAADIPITYGNAEQLIVAKPDLILAGAYTRANIPLLRQLGFNVVEVPPATTLDEVSDNIRAVGEAIGETEKAEAMVAEIEAELAALRDDDSESPVVAPLYANAYTSGPGTLVDAVIEEAGLTSIGKELGISGMQKLSLETLLMKRPDALLLPDHRYSGDALAYDIFRHPALRALKDQIPSLDWDSAATVCGTPNLVHVVKRLHAFRDELIAAKTREATAP
jgi:iron complex transport system substrate-binding protein